MKAKQEKSMFKYGMVLFYFMLKSSAEYKCIYRQIIRSQISLQWNRCMANILLDITKCHFWLKMLFNCISQHVVQDP